MKTRFTKANIVVVICVLTCGLTGDGSAAEQNAAANAVKTASEKENSQRAEKFKLQYRTAGDAIAPSRFLLVSDRGLSLTPLTLKWSFPKLSGKKRKAQKKQKEAFASLIKRLEKRSMSAEFECTGAWTKPLGAHGPDLLNNSLRVMSVPQLTKKSKDKLRRFGVRLTD